MMQIFRDIKLPGSEVDVITVPRTVDGCVQISLGLDSGEFTEDADRGLFEERV